MFDEWLSLDIIERLESEVGGLHYLPHRAIIKENSLTTKIRPIYNASSPLTGSLSLNDCLATGPNLIELIPTVLNKFRRNKIGAPVGDRRRRRINGTVE